MLLADRIYAHCFNNGPLTPARNDARLAARMREAHDSLLAECARWAYRTPANWESAAATTRSSLFPKRTDELVAILRTRGFLPSFDPPALNQYGGVAASGFQPQLASSKGPIYYTVDGGDPRLPGGAISPNALVWKPGAVSITQDLTLFARVRTTAGQWSALAQPRFLAASRREPGTRDLLITEIQYNPADGKECQFAELCNVSTNLLDLTGVQLGNAVRFAFTNGFSLKPGEIVLIVENTEAFAALYQNTNSPGYWPGIRVAGAWTGSLDQTASTLSLVASNGIELASAPYSSEGDWPSTAGGSSIELRILPPDSASDAEARAMLADGRNWSASALFSGSPGRLDATVTGPFALEAEIAFGEFRLSFPAIIGQSYRVEFTDSLSPAGWQLLREIGSAPSLRMVIPDPHNGGEISRYYRVLWMR
jgi:hypothetical protein